MVTFFSLTELRRYLWKCAGGVKFSNRTKETESDLMSRFAQEHKVLLRSTVNIKLV